MRALFISDLHLNENDADTHRRFLHFLGTHAKHAQRLYILGDLFHQWLGDAQLAHDGYAASVARALRETRDAGCDIRLMVGNRDFMIGMDFARAIGATLLPDEALETLGERSVLLLHGDTLCTDDVGYQRARRWLRHPLFKPAVAPLPFFLRERIARTIRSKSSAHKKMLSADIMDVSREAVRETFARARVNLMIHGHTHRPQWHFGETGNADQTRIVLTDWQRDENEPLQILQWENGEFSLQALS